MNDSGIGGVTAISNGDDKWVSVLNYRSFAFEVCYVLLQMIKTKDVYLSRITNRMRIRIAAMIVTSTVMYSMRSYYPMPLLFLI